MRRAGLWTNGDFLKVWTGRTISQLGSEVSGFALPLVAVLTLHARPAQLGVFYVAGSMASIAIALFAGAWTDRRARRAILIVCDLASAAIVASIPLVATFGTLTMTHLYAVGVVGGLVEPFFWTSFDAYLPTLVEREALIDANGKLAASESGVAIVGPAVGGALVGIFSAIVAMVIDAVSFAVSAGFLFVVRRREPATDAPPEGRHLLAEIGEGWNVILNDRTQRSILLVEAIRIVGALVWPNYVLFALEVLEISPLGFGVVGSIGAIGFLAGSLLGPRVTRRIGIGRMLMLGSVLILASPFFMPFAPSGSPWAMVLLIAAAITGATGDVAISVTLRGYRQAITPQRLLGRVTATSFVVTGVAFMIGPIVGGVLGETIGIRQTILIAACLHVVYPLVLWRSPLRAIDAMPASTADDGP